MKQNNINLDEEAIVLLKEIVEWWDIWNNSNSPAKVYDPPIEEARQILSKKGINLK